MNPYINFTTSPTHPDRTFAGGVPLHDGKIPNRFRSVRGVAFDGVPVEFVDGTTTDRLHQSLVEGRSLSKRSTIFDCLVFAALMNEVRIGTPGADGRFVFNETTDKCNIDPDDTTNVHLTNIGAIRGGNDEVDYCHTIVPAHTIDGAAYLHKLGSRGAVCLSGLSDALEMYRCTVAHPMTSLRFGA